MRAVRRWAISGALVACALTVAAADSDRGGHTRRADLVGAWRLVRIEVTGPQGASADAFYGTGSEGLMIYDRDGYFSVQIMGANRPVLAVPARRPEPADPAQGALKVAALDSYYAYYGTWTFDPKTSTVTHHATGALYPSERDAIYPQHVDVQGSTMTFTRTQDVDGHRLTQTKRWTRVAATDAHH